MQRYTVTEIRNGTGFERGQKFIRANDPHLLDLLAAQASFQRILMLLRDVVHVHEND